MHDKCAIDCTTFGRKVLNQTLNLIVNLNKKFRKLKKKQVKTRLLWVQLVLSKPSLPDDGESWTENH